MSGLKELEAVKYEKLLGRISNSTQLEKFISAIEVAENQLRTELDDFIDSRRHAQESRKLELARTEISTSLNSSSDLVDLLTNAGALASKITAKVRLLDAERSRVRETEDYVTKVKELRNSILTANFALEHRDWESAAHAINKIRSLPIEGEFINTVVPSTDVPENPAVVLERWTEQLTDLFTHEFNKAADERDVEKLTKFFQLFPLIGKSNIGLDCYSKFICNIIASQSRSIITNQSEQDKIGFYPAALMKLLEIVSTMINQHSKIIASYYGLEYMTGIIERVERETDSQAGLISDTFYDNRNINRILDEVQSYKFPFLTSSSSSSNNRSSTPPRQSFESTRPSEDHGSISVIEIVDLTSEFSSLLNNWSLYCRFIAVKWNEYQNIQQEELTLPKPLVDSKFSKKVQAKFLPSFEVLLTFYIRRSLEQAFQIEEIPSLDHLITQRKLIAPEQPPVSSIAEDLILILSNSLKQAIQTGQPVTLKNIINNVKKITENDYVSTLTKRLKEFHPRPGTVLTVATNQTAHIPNKPNTVGGIFMRGANALNQITTGDETRLHTFIILLNTIDIEKVYFEQMIQKNIELLHNNFPFGSDSSKLELILNNLNDQFSKRSNGILDENITILFNNVLKNKLRILLTDCFKDSDYLISTFDSEENTITATFIQQWNALMNSYYKVLDSRIYDKLIYTIVSTLSNLLERKLWSLEKNINELGSIKLEKDYSGIIGEITRSKYNLRDKFLRVTQIIMILGFDDEDDEIDLNWVLTPSERQRARSLRVDRK